MKLAMIVNPLTERNLQWAAQVGVEEIVLTYPGPGLEPLLAARRMVEAAGMRLAIVERKIPHLQMVHGLPGRDAEVAQFKELLRDMAEAGLTVACYNWMPSEDWQRTSSTVRERGGALVTEFNLADVGRNVTDADGAPPVLTSAERLWENLKRFLGDVPAVLMVDKECTYVYHDERFPFPVGESSHDERAVEGDDPAAAVSPIYDPHGRWPIVRRDAPRLRNRVADGTHGDCLRARRQLQRRRSDADERARCSCAEGGRVTAYGGV